MLSNPIFIILYLGTVVEKCVLAFVLKFVSISKVNMAGIQMGLRMYRRMLIPEVDPTREGVV